MLSPTGTVEAGYDHDPFGNPRTGPTLARPASPDQPAQPPGGSASPSPSPSPSGSPSPTGSTATGTVGRTADPGPRNPMRYAGAYQDSTTGDGNHYLRERNYNPGTGRFTSTDPMPTGASKTSAYMEILGVNDVINCLKGDLGAGISTVVGALPWGKIFKAKKIIEAIWRVGKAVVTFFRELNWARAILRGAAKAAEAAKTVVAKAARAAAEKAAPVKAAAEAYVKKAAAEAAARIKATAAKARPRPNPSLIASPTALRPARWC